MRNWLMAFLFIIAVHHSGDKIYRDKEVVRLDTGKSDKEAEKEAWERTYKRVNDMLRGVVEGTQERINAVDYQV